MKDVDDDAGAVEHLRAGGLLEVASLIGRQLMVDHHHRRAFFQGRFVDDRRGLDVLFGFFLFGLPRFLRPRLPVLRARRNLAGAAGQLRELLQLALAEHGARGEPFPLL
jgi:hypothetical protein